MDAHTRCATKHTGATRRVAKCWLTCTTKRRPLLRCEVVLRVIWINRLHHCARCASWARHTGRATSRDNLFSLPRSPEQLVPPTTSSLQQRGQLLMARDNKVLGLAAVSVQAAAGAARWLAEGKAPRRAQQLPLPGHPPRPSPPRAPRHSRPGVKVNIAAFNVRTARTKAPPGGPRAKWGDDENIVAGSNLVPSRGPSSVMTGRFVRLVRQKTPLRLPGRKRFGALLDEYKRSHAEGARTNSTRVDLKGVLAEPLAPSARRARRSPP